MAHDDPLVRDFLVEVRENLDRLDQALVALEQHPGDREMLDQIFRAMHSTKGAAGFMQFEDLESIAHAGENLLNAVREGSVPMDGETTSVLLSALDALRSIAGAIEQGATPARAAHDPLLASMNALMAGAARLDAHAAEAAPATTPPAAASPTGPPAAAAPPTAAPEAPAPASPSPSPPPASMGSPPRGEPPARPEDAHDTVRVDVELLDELMDLVGELVLSRNQILRVTQTQESSGELGQGAQQLNRITTELQERVMKTRMQPIKHVWGKFPRIVRDLSHQLGKQVRLEMVGEETELDRTLIDAIKDPLTHLVRNAVDHGVEKPEARIAAGKDPEGHFRLAAYHESGQVIIEVDDDGAGIRVDAIKRKALEKGLITADQASSMSAKDATRLVFLPGLSTASAVTTISGRGVGMDVVRSNIEKIGGTIEVDSEEGRGTRFRLQIPLTLAIIPALLVVCSGSRFAIPQASVLELIRLKADTVRKSISVVHGTLATKLRGQILPLVDLKSIVMGDREGTLTAGLAHGEGTWDGPVNFVVVQAGHRKFGLVVDGIEESQEIVVKPLGRQLQDLRVYAGATILGDGSIALILDTMGVAVHARIVGEREEDAAAALAAQSEEKAEHDTILLVQTSAEGRLAIPLGAVARLEQFERERIERAGPREVVQYRGEIMRLTRPSELLPGEPEILRDADARLDVVVLQGRMGSVGLVVERILDIAEVPREPLKAATRAGLLGTAVVRGRVTEFLDVPRAIQMTEALQALEATSVA